MSVSHPLLKLMKGEVFVLLYAYQGRSERNFSVLMFEGCREMIDQSTRARTVPQVLTSHSHKCTGSETQLPCVTSMAT